MDSCLKFLPFDGDTESLLVNQNYLVFRWVGPGKILFSVTRKGDAAYCHFCSDRDGLRHTKQAFNDFVSFVFYLFDWCKMIIASVVEKPSIERLLVKCGFQLFATVPKKRATVYMRCK